MPKFTESPWIPMLLSTGIILCAFIGITYVLVNKLEPESAQTKVSYSKNEQNTPKNKNSKPKNTNHERETPLWSYEGEHGPAHWGQFVPLAQNGIRQSPIDLVLDHTLNPANLNPVDFHYQDSIMTVKNTGKTIQADCDPANGIIIDGHHYTLKHFQFHARSEHWIDGRDYPMEVHLVHVISDQQNEDLPPTLTATKPAPNSLAVIGVMIKEGHPNELIKDLWSEVPKYGDAPLRYKIPGQNASAFLPPVGKRSFFRYNGSQTTPPCTENVLWTVMTEPIEFSKDQIDTFKKLYPSNNRPVQKTHQRFVLHYQDSPRPADKPSQITQPKSPHHPSPSPTPASSESPRSLPPTQPTEPNAEDFPLSPTPPREPRAPLRPQLSTNQPASTAPLTGTPVKPIPDLND